jgi:2-polyprenyl-3-methyl-5-hydroxy-6-metoxy-1,4-benzoquinol methylase/tetratricopeptide (TPR) repeat protein
MANRKQRRAARKLTEHSGLASADHPANGASSRRSNAHDPVTRLFAAAVQFHNRGQLSEAETLYRNILERHGDQSGVHRNLASLYRSLSQYDRAIKCYLKGIELTPDDLDLHNDFCTALMVQGQFEAAAAHYESIIAYRPDYVYGYTNLAVAHLGIGQVERALTTVQKALALAQLPESKSLWVKCLQALPAPPNSALTRDLMVRAMTEPWGRPSDLARHCAALIKTDSDIAGCIDRAQKAWPRRLGCDELFGPSGLAAMASDPVLRALLENARNSDLILERCLTNVRHVLLATALNIVAADAPDLNPPGMDTPGIDIVRFYCALAQQCFINEYIFPLADGEWQQVEQLRQRVIAALQADAAVPALWIAATSAYMPLACLSDCDKLWSRALSKPWPEPIEALLVAQIREPAEETTINHSIPVLTPVQDRVSTLVQQQYEENPYPRWRKVVPVSGVNSIDARLRGQFPFSDYRNLAKDGPLDVLVAGCGTGQQLVDVAQRIAGARVLAIDLSRTSLAYAKRKTDALGIGNIDYGQADILELPSLGRSFDIIDCGGVLHHLGDPAQGWRVLVSLLRPGGVMRIALYSELARRYVVAARAFVAERGYGRSADDIRRFRQDVQQLPDDSLAKLVAHSPDFFSISDCRDLAFHVQESRFTLPQIRDFLATNDLTFLGFEMDHGIARRYSAQFPHDRARNNLDQWHAFEQGHPGTFGGMYQFWVQKAATC